MSSSFKLFFVLTKYSAQVLNWLVVLSLLDVLLRLDLNEHA